MRKINFTKMVAAGNDFVVVKSMSSTGRFGSLRGLAKRICDRKYGVGADGLLVLEKSRVANIRMRIFNADGSEAEMCGNGARCVALYISRKPQAASRQLEIETKAGIIQVKVKADTVKIKLTDPKDIKLDLPIKINHRLLKINFINTGVPHCVVFVDGLDKIDVFNLGRQIRYYSRFAPAGTNVNFAEALNNKSVRIRTYERGVEGETLACGTGSVASALIYASKLGIGSNGRVNVLTKSGETLEIYFKKIKGSFKDVWLEGNAKKVYKGVYYV